VSVYGCGGEDGGDRVRGGHPAFNAENKSERPINCNHWIPFSCLGKMWLSKLNENEELFYLL